MTEMVLLLPVFLLFMFGFVKIFALLVLVQKVEIASVYAATRWQFESHRNVIYDNDDMGALRNDINRQVRKYIGFDNPSVSGFLDLDTCKWDPVRTQVWSMVTLKVTTRPWGLAKFLEDPNRPGQLSKGFTFESTKYVPSRDRPIRYLLPGAD